MSESPDENGWKELLGRQELKSPAFWREIHMRDLRRRYARRAPQIRSQIFTQELRDLANQVRVHRPGEINPVAAASPLQNKPAVPFLHFEDFLPDLSDSYHAIMRLHAGGDALVPSALLDDLVSNVGAHSAALLLFSREESVFRTVCATGLDPETRKNLWIPVHDPFFDQVPFERIEVSDRLKGNPFFRKRFSPAFLEKMGAALVCRRTDLYYPSLLVFFFEEASGIPADLESRTLQGFLDWVHPLLIRQLERASSMEPGRNIYLRVAREVRAFLSLGRGGILLQFHFDHMKEKEVSRRFIREVRQSLSHGRNCLALRIRHDSLKLLLPETEADRPGIIRSIETLAAGFGVSVRYEEQIVGPEFVSSMVL